MSLKKLAATIIPLALASGVSGVCAETLRTEFTGPGKCLDIVNDGTNNKLIMADCGNSSGQDWMITRDEAHSKLTTKFTGPDKCLDIINDGTNNRLIMATCGNYSGQMWSVTPTGDGHFKLMTEFTGSNKCLDIVNDGNNNQLIMAVCGNYSGQLWNIGEESGRSVVPDRAQALIMMSSMYSIAQECANKGLIFTSEEVNAIDTALKTQAAALDLSSSEEEALRKAGAMDEKKKASLVRDECNGVHSFVFGK